MFKSLRSSKQEAKTSKQEDKVKEIFKMTHWTNCKLEDLVSKDILINVVHDDGAFLIVYVEIDGEKYGQKYFYIKKSLDEISTRQEVENHQELKRLTGHNVRITMDTDNNFNFEKLN